ncbi:MAG: restriction endonuclease subunit S [Burkholderiales bacterium]|nr:restriction endonuclease subunit S [Burkholderiales bacterium]
MGVRPGYKQTDIGVIPAEWGVRSIGQMFRLVNGCPFKPADWKQSGTPIIRIQNLNDPYAPFNFSQAPVPERNRVEPGDLLFAWSGTIGTSFGARVWAGPSGVLNQHIFKVHMDQEQITLPFSLLVFARVEEDIAKQAHGFKASFVHVKKSDLVKVDLPVPPVPEQRAIAAALSDVDALLGALDRLIAKKRDLKQAAMQQLLTGQTRLPSFHDEWEVRRFGEVALPRRDRVDPRRAGVQDFCIELEHIESESGELLGSTTTGDQSSLKSVFRAGDVLFGKLRAYLRKYWLATRAGVCSTEVWVLAPKDRLVTTGFLFQLIKTDEFIEAASNSYGTHMPRSDWNIVKNFEFSLPPLPEQGAIADALGDMDAELLVLDQRRDKTRDLKQAMIQELLTGRTRLV